MESEIRNLIKLRGENFHNQNYDFSSIDFNFIGKVTKGIEPSKTFHKVHSALGLNCNVGFIKDIREKYDLVLLSHVFEHLTNLHEMVDILSNITNKYFKER